MAKDGGDLIATGAFCIHEIGIGALHQVLLLHPSPEKKRKHKKKHLVQSPIFWM